MKKKILIIGKKGFISKNLIKFFSKKKKIFYSISFKNFIIKSYLYNKKFDYIINCDCCCSQLLYDAAVGGPKRCRIRLVLASADTIAAFAQQRQQQQQRNNNTPPINPIMSIHTLNT